MQETNTLTGEKIEKKEVVNPFVTEYKLYVDANDKIPGGIWAKLDNVAYDPYLNYTDVIWLASGVGTDDWDNNKKMEVTLIYLSLK